MARAAPPLDGGSFSTRGWRGRCGRWAFPCVAQPRPFSPRIPQLVLMSSCTVSGETSQSSGSADSSAAAAGCRSRSKAQVRLRRPPAGHLGGPAPWCRASACALSPKSSSTWVLVALVVGVVPGHESVSAAGSGEPGPCLARISSHMTITTWSIDRTESRRGASGNGREGGRENAVRACDLRPRPWEDVGRARAAGSPRMQPAVPSGGRSAPWPPGPRRGQRVSRRRCGSGR